NALYRATAGSTADKTPLKVSPPADLHQIAKQWVNGAALDWSSLHPGSRPTILSLPGYPFTPTRFVLPKEGRGSGAEKRLHPLVHRNTSTLMEQRFTTSLNGHEFYLDHHRVHGNRLLPGVAMLEMARAAGESAGCRVHTLEQIKWLRPIQVDEPLEVAICLHPVGRDVACEIIGTGEEQTLYAEGILHLGPRGDTPVTPPLSELRQRCRPTIEAEQCYRTFRNRGLEYGASFQALRRLGHSSDEVLAELQLPEGVGTDGFGLHPSIMDGALQAAIGFTLSSDRTTTLVPSAIERLSIHKLPGQHAYAWLRRRGSANVDEPLLDIRLLDDNGELTVAIDGFAMRRLQIQQRMDPLPSTDARLEELLY
ncbi:MAG: hypothetical protein GY731_03900, partial [Gammaproteobacteria bacterium]|nr:hypothetical protein [Gammaproteobacteria bacterium]